MLQRASVSKRRRKKKATAAALALMELLGEIRLDPITDEKVALSVAWGSTEKDFKPYCLAHTRIKTLALLNEQYKGSNWWRWEVE
ncbi:hypothetical protein ACFLU6_06040 [Acidobacteriota bacterium]